VAKILIVDDDAQLVGMMTEYLTSKGHRVFSASDPAKGMQLARKEKPELVILDYHMPGDTGAHLFEAFRRNQAFELTPVLFMSGSKPEKELLDEIASRSRTAYLKKGVPLEEITQKIDELLSAS
jgi:DNA-binding response OmpR family regulator